MSAHYTVLALRVPGTGEPGGLPSMESHRVRDYWSNLAAAAAAAAAATSICFQCLCFCLPILMFSIAFLWYWKEN